MDNLMMEEMTRRIAALEARVASLERQLGENPQGGVKAGILRRFPVCMDKTRAAEALGVTRATVYAMLSDGRLAQNAMGKVLTESVAALLQPGTPIRKHAWTSREALRMGADHQ